MLHLLVSDRVEPLAGALAEVLATPLADPMQAEWVAIPTEGMHRWLQLELARSLGARGPGTGDGVAANIEFPFPGALRRAVLAADREDDRADPWRVEHLVWAVLEVLHTHRDDERLGPLTTLPEGGTWFGRARRLADLFDRYAVRRPELIQRWNDHRDFDAAGFPLAPHDQWQPHLWRLTRACIDAPSPPERLPELLDAVRAGTLALDLPPRLAVFGVTTLPGGAPFLELARAVAEHRELSLFLLDPSPTARDRVRSAARDAAGAAAAGPGGPAVLRTEDGTERAVHHPLLRSWGRPYRERTVLLAGAEALGLPEPRPIGIEDESVEPSTLLARVQRDLRADAVPAGDFELAADDRSIQVHSCHGPGRQVEVLRDAILHLLAEDPTLREEDIVVLSPAIEEFAPWIEAGFGTSADRTSSAVSSDRPRLAYRIADRSLRESYPLLAALGTLLELVSGRFTASAVLEFLSLAPVRTRFDLDDDAIAVIGQWVADTNVRWGIDGEHRASWGVPAAFTANSWRAALDRLLIGVAVSEDDTSLAPGEIAPLGVEGGDIAVAGRLADVLAHLGAIADDMERDRPAAEWCDAILDASERLLGVEVSQQWQLDRLRQIIADLAEDSALGAPGSSVVLTLADVRRMLEDRLEGAPRRLDFFRGGITFSSLTPLRWLPFRVVCLLGLDERALTTGATDGDDLTTQSPRLGDRDPRSELRQALLEAVLAVDDHLVITRTGHNILTNQEVPESVAFAELRDVITATLAGDAPDLFRHHIETAHPHQPFDERNFRPDALRVGPWSFDPDALAGARARASRATERDLFVTTPLPERVDDGPAISLADLHTFLNHPVKAFLKRRLGMHIPRDDGVVSDHLPTVLDALDRWSLASRLIDARIAGRTNDEWARQERARSSLPAGGFGDEVVEDVANVVDKLLRGTEALGIDLSSRATIPVDVELADGTRIVGVVDGRAGSVQPGPVRLTYSRAKPKQHLAAWLDLMVLVAQDPERPWRSVFVRRNEKGDEPDPLELTALSRESALEALAVVVDLYRRGQREPVPLFSELSPKLHERVATSGHWNHNMGWGDGDDEANQLAFGAIDLRDLRAITARPDDPGGRAPDRATRYADYLWEAVERSARIVTREEPDPSEPDGEALIDPLTPPVEVAR